MAGGSKTIKQTKSRFNQKDPGQAEKQDKISKYNATLLEYSSSTTKSALWGAKGAPEGEFDGLGAEFEQFGIVFANLWLLFAWPGSFDQIPIWSNPPSSLKLERLRSQRQASNLSNLQS